MGQGEEMHVNRGTMCTHLGSMMGTAYNFCDTGMTCLGLELKPHLKSNTVHLNTARQFRYNTKMFPSAIAFTNRIHRMFLKLRIPRYICVRKVLRFIPDRKQVFG